MPQYSHYQVSRSFPTLQKIETKPIHWQQIDKVGKFTYQSTSDQHLQQSHENWTPSVYYVSVYNNQLLRRRLGKTNANFNSNYSHEAWHISATFTRSTYHVNFVRTLKLDHSEKITPFFGKISSKKFWNWTTIFLTSSGWVFEKTLHDNRILK